MSEQRNAALRKHSVTIAGHPTSISLEDPFWEALCDIARERDQPVARLVAEIDARRGGVGGLSSAVRLFVLDHYRGCRACRS